MLAIARALMLRPRLLLLDEPSFGLAPLIVQEIFDIMRRIRDEEGVSILLVEQNASLALAIADRAYLLETGRIVMSRPRRARSAKDEAVRRSYLGYLRARMDGFLHQIALRHRHRRHLRQRGAGAGDDLPGDPPREFRPGRDGDVLHLHRADPDPGRRAVLGGLRASPSSISFVIGAVIERMLMRPMADAPVLASVGVFIGLLLIFNSVAGWIFGYTIKPFPSPFGRAAAVRRLRLAA